MGLINTLLGIPLGYVMYLCYSLIGNYGLAIIVFTLFTKFILFPLSIWVQKNSIKMIRIQPELNQISAKYVGRRDKISEEHLACYKREHYKPLLSIVPMLIQVVLVLGLIGVMYNPLQHILHIDSSIIDAFGNVAKGLLGVDELGASGQLKILELIHNPQHAASFAAVQLPGHDIGAALTSIGSFNTSFLGMDLTATPVLNGFSLLAMLPLISGFSAFLMCFFQNRINVLQREQGWLGKWGMAIFMTAFSTYFTFLVPAGVGLYWIFGNLFSILVMYAVNWLFKPAKYIDYAALEQSKKALAESKAIERTLKMSKEQKLKAKTDYKRFFADPARKELVFYAEKSGFYKYFRAVIDYVLTHSDVVIHYVTSDYNDAIFKADNPRIVPYYIKDNHLIPLFMKLECKVMVMTTPDLQNFHLKRSFIDKKIEYIYMFHGLASTHMAVRKGAYDHFDTVFCVGQHQIDELRESEQLYDRKAKKLVPVGYGMFDEMLADYQAIQDRHNEPPQILIAPSYQDDNIMDCCIEPMLDALVGARKYKVILRPHPQYIKHNPGKIEKFALEHKELLGDFFVIESDFSSNESIFASDLLITDWSGIAYEFSYTTKRPSLFVNTPPKIINPDYDKQTCQPLDITLRDQVGVSIAPDDVGPICQNVDALLADKDAYRDKIEALVERYVFHIGHSGEVGGQYILDQLSGADKK